MDLGGRSYPILVGEVLGFLPDLVAARASRVALIADPAAARTGDEVLRALRSRGLAVTAIAVEGGERAKTMAGLERLLGFLESSRIGRDGCVVAVGGGSVGDVAGLAAALWQRGVPLFQVPTTLLAMVDSAIGGKTGINTSRAKNAVGVFWQPAAVLADLSALDSLPDEEYRAAFGEVVKYAVAMDRDLADLLRDDSARLLARDPGVLQPVVARCAALKAGAVAADERDLTGRRAILNYGHTVGHAIEAALDYQARHGQAVAQGMRAAARLAADLELCDAALVEAQDDLLGRFGLPGALPAVAASSVLAGLPRDKKAADGRPRWVLPRRLGHAEAGFEAADGAVRKAVEAVLGTSAA